MEICKKKLRLLGTPYNITDEQMFKCPCREFGFNVDQEGKQKNHESSFFEKFDF